jgi:hypothetical protein
LASGEQVLIRTHKPVCGTVLIFSQVADPDQDLEMVGRIDKIFAEKAIGVLK